LTVAKQTISDGLSGSYDVNVDQQDLGAGVAQNQIVQLTVGTQLVDASHGIPIRDDGTTISVDDGGSSITVDGTVAATQSGTWNVGTVTTITNVVHVDDNGSTLSIDDGAGSLTVDNGGTFAVQDSQVVADNAAFTDGTTKVFAAGYVYDEVAGTALTENDAAAARIDVKRAQVLTIEDATTRGQRATVSAAGALKVDNSAVTQPVSGTVTVQDGGGAISIDDNGSTISIDDGAGSITVDNGGTFAVQAAQSGTWNINAISTAVAVTDNSGSLTVDNAGTFAVQDSQVITDNAGFTDGTSKLFQAGYIFDEVAGTALTENDAAAARVDSKRAQVLVLEDASTRGQRATVSAGGALKVDASSAAVPVTDNGGSLTVDNAGTFAVQATQSGTWNVGTVSTITNVVHIDDNASTISIDDGGGSITVDGTVAISGSVTANAGTGFPSVQTEDAASAGGETGLMILGVRNDAAASKTSLDGDFSAIAVDSAGRVGISDLGGAISIDDNGSSITVDGTVAATQSGTWNITNVSGTVSLPTGAATAAKQPALGTAGTASADVITVQGITGMTAVKVDGSAVTQPVSGTVTANAGTGTFTVSGAVTNTVLSVVGGGTEATAQRVTIASDSTGVLSVDDNGGSLTVDGTVGISGTVAVTDNSGSLTVDNAGTFAVQDSQAITDNAGFTDGTSKVFAAGYIYDEVAGTALTENDAAAARINVNRAQVAAIEDGATRGRYATVSASNALKVDGSAVTQPVSDGGGSLTVDGTVAISGTVAVTDNAGSLTVDNSTLSVVGGGTEATAMRVTIASDSTGVLSVDDNGGSLTVDGTVAATQSGTWSTRTQDGAGNATTSHLAGSSRGLDVAIIDGSGNQITSFSGGTQYTEDAASAGGETGTLMLAVRNDAAASKTSLDGDYSAIAVDAAGRVGIADLGGSISVDDNGSSLTVDGTVTANAGSGTFTISGAVTNTVLSVVGGGTEATAQRVTIASDSTGVLSVDDNGGSLTIDNAALSVTGGGVEASALRVTIANDSTGLISVDDNGSSLTVDNSGTFAVQDSQTITDNAGFTDGTSKLSMSGYIYDEVAGTALTENDAAAARINVNRAQVATIEDGTTRGRYATVSAANALKVDGSAVTQPVSIAAAVPVTDNSGSLTVDAPVATPVFVRLSDGAAAISALPVTDNGTTLSIDDGAGSLTVDGTVAATQSGTWNITNVSGTVSLPTGAATDATLTGGTVKAIARGGAKGSTTAADVTSTASGANHQGLDVVIYDTSGNPITSFGGATPLVDNAGFTDGTSTVTPIGMIYDEVAGTALTENDVAAPRINANRAQVMVIEDGTTRGRRATVDANGALYISGIQDSSTSGNITTAATTVGPMSVANRNVVTVTISGTYTGVNITFEASDDSGTTWFTVQGARVDTGVVETTSGVLGSTLRGWDFPVGAWTNFRVRSTAWASGTAVVRITAQTFAFDPAPAAVAQGAAAAGSAIAGNPVLMGGSDGTNARAILTGTDGRISGNIAQVNGATVNVGVGAASTGTLRVATSTDSTIGTVTAVTNVATIGTSVTPGTAAANLGKAEDAVAASGDTGVAVWAVRTDTPATTTSGSGDYHPFEVDANGALWTHPIQSSFRIEVDSAGLTTATTAYTSGDHAGTVNTFANAARVTGWGGVITGAALIDKSLKVSTISVELWLFQSQPASPGADNAALTFADTDMNNFVGIITFDSGSWKTTALNAVNHQANLGMGYTCAATSLFGYYVLRGVPSGNFFSATSDLRVSLQMLRD